MKYALFIGGLFLIAGAAGSQDFYDVCRAAADCVAGDPPSMLVTIAQSLAGVGAMIASVLLMMQEND